MRSQEAIGGLIKQIIAAPDEARKLGLEPLTPQREHLDGCLDGILSALIWCLEDDQKEGNPFEAALERARAIKEYRERWERKKEAAA